MQLISYLSRGQVRSARLVGELGIDLNNAAGLYVKKHPALKLPLDSLPISLVDLFLSGPEGLGLSSDATNWVLGFSPESDAEIMESGTVFHVNDFTLLAPVPRPGKVICIAGNYAAPNKLEKPKYPTVFLKPSGGVIGDKHTVVIPMAAESVAYEVELAVVIGKHGKNLTLREAVSFVAGYTIANDLGDRLLEKRTTQWTSGKMFDTFTPLGPVLITPGELRNTGNLAMFTRVNGQIMQKGNTSQMFFDVPHLIVYLSTLTTLEPGDVILTGSPKLMDGEPNPTGALKAGDVVEVSIEKLTSLTNPIIHESEAAG